MAVDIIIEMSRDHVIKLSRKASISHDKYCHAKLSRLVRTEM